MSTHYDKIIFNKTQSNSYIEDTEFWNCVFYNATFTNIKFNNCYFHNCIFKNTNYEDCAFSYCAFSDSQFINSKCAITITDKVIFTDTLFSTTTLNITNLNKAKFINCGANNITAPNEILSYFFPLACPETGSFIAYKAAQIVTFTKTSNNFLISCSHTPVIIKLLIPENTKRSSSQTRKCRASKAKVLEITDLDGNQYTQAESIYYHLTYTLDETIEIEDFDEDRWKECAKGIHFFLTKEEAINYLLR